LAKRNRSGEKGAAHPAARAAHGRSGNASHRGPENASHGAPENPSRTPWLHAILLIAIILAVFANGLRSPFVADDSLAIVGNTHIRQITDVRSVLNAEQESPFAGRPLANLSFAINYALHGERVLGYHVVNLAVHVACALLVLALVRRTLTSRRIHERIRAAAGPLALLSAVIWAIHPLNTEVVDYLTQRTESLMALCLLATLYASARALDGDRRRLWQAAAVASCALGMGAKESMAIAPAIVILYDAAFLFDSAGDAWRSRWRLYVCLCATWLVLVPLLMSGPRAYSAGFSAGLTPWAYLLNQCLVIPHYLRLVVWPRGLVHMYGPPVPLTLGDVLPQFIALLSAAALSVVLWLRWRPVGFGALWVIVTLAPASSVVPIATEVGAERRMYLPLVAFVVLFVAAGAWIAEAARRWFPGARHAAIAGAAAICALLAWTSVTRNAEYHDRLELARLALERRPTGAAHNAVGDELAARGQHDEALAEYRKAAETYSVARFALGSELFDRGQYREAIADLRTFVEANPMRAAVIPAHLKIAHALTELHDWAGAEAEAREVLRMTPHNVEAHFFLAEALAGASRLDAAVAEYRTYLSMRPTDVGAWTSLGTALIDLERTGEARAAYAKAAELAPNDARVRANFARALLLDNDIPGALQQAQLAIKLDPTSGANRDLLGRVFALQQRWGEARAQYEAAARLDPRDAEAREALQAIAELEKRR
jgi:tetratricopeptide (TPR) repeat protein